MPLPCESGATADSADPRVLRLPWELLADEGGHVFAQGIGVRRRLRKTQTANLKPFSLPVRILVLVSRPEGAGFIDPRADSKALLESVEPLAVQVEVEFLYPPTLEALTRRLRLRVCMWCILTDTGFTIPVWGWVICCLRIRITTKIRWMRIG